MDEMTFEPHSPITDEEWDMIADYDFENSNEITFHTKHGKDVTFWKAPHWIPCKERMPSEGENVLLCDTLFGNVAIGKLIRYNTSCCWEVDNWDCDLEDWQAWMPLPEPYEEGKE